MRECEAPCYILSEESEENGKRWRVLLEEQVGYHQRPNKKYIELTLFKVEIDEDDGNIYLCNNEMQEL
jgi:hypothetical protein